MNVKIEQELNFVVDNDSRLFLDAQGLGLLLGTTAVGISQLYSTTLTLHANCACQHALPINY